MNKKGEQSEFNELDYIIFTTRTHRQDIRYPFSSVYLLDGKEDESALE